MSDITLINDSEQSSLVTNGLAKNGEMYLKKAGSTDAGSIVVYDSGVWKTFANEYSAGFANTYSVDLDGTDDNILVGDVSTLNSSSAFTISARFKADASGGYVFGFRGFYARLDASGIYGRISKFYTWSNSGSGDVYHGLGNWHHIVVVWDAPNVICYVDGSEIINVNPGAGNATGSDNGNSFRIGSHYGGSVALFNGKIDEVAIWSKALSSSEVTGISGSLTDLSQTASSDLKHWWRMGDNDNGTGTTLTDQGSGAINATLINGPTFSTDVPS